MTILTRNTFDISRESEYFGESELSMQVGYAKKDWAIVLLKELIDNALDAVESNM
jgi:DNA topoisomerase VI subunit B